MNNNITRDEIATFIHEEFGLAKKDCNDIVNDIVEEIIKGLEKNNIVKIHNFGTFKTKHKKQRKGRNPKTKKEVMISSRNVISFTPSKKFMHLINSNDK